MIDLKNIVLKQTQLISKQVNDKQIPGACFSIVTPTQIAYSSCGYKSLIPQQTETTTETLYDIASLSKVVSTSTMIAKLIEDNLLTFDTKVSSILDNFIYDDVTILDLIVHTSGYPADDKNYKKCLNKEELYNFILHLPRTYQRGTKVEYSCFNYIILGKIIEKLKGNMEDYANEVLFNYLGNNHILYNPINKGRLDDCAPTERSDIRGIIQGEVHDGKAYILGGVAGNAGVFADIEGLSYFVEMMLNNGMFKGNQILQKETIDLFKESYTYNLNESRTMGGWYYGDLTTSAGTKVSKHSLYHTGFTGTSIYIDYDRNCGIVLLTNAIHPSRETSIVKVRKSFHEQIIDYIDHNS